MLKNILLTLCTGGLWLVYLLFRRKALTAPTRSNQKVRARVHVNWRDVDEELVDLFPNADHRQAACYMLQGMGSLPINDEVLAEMRGILGSMNLVLDERMDHNEDDVYFYSGAHGGTLDLSSPNMIWCTNCKGFREAYESDGDYEELLCHSCDRVGKATASMTSREMKRYAERAA